MGDNNKTATPLTEEQLLKLQEEVVARETAVAERETKVEAAEKALKAKGTDKKEKVVSGEKFDYEKQSYQFSDSCPKNILVNGKKYSQKELVKDEEALALILPHYLQSGNIKKQ